MTLKIEDLPIDYEIESYISAFYKVNFVDGDKIDIKISNITLTGIRNCCYVKIIKDKGTFPENIVQLIGAQTILNKIKEIKEKEDGD